MVNIVNTIRTPDGIRLCVRVVPNSSKCSVAGVIDGALKIKLGVPPVEGKANEKCVNFLAKLLGVPKTGIKILSGDKSKNKVLLIKGNPDEIEEKISGILSG